MWKRYFWLHERVCSKFDNNAELDCCCEFQVEAIVSDLEGDYTFKDECTNFSYVYESTITGMNGISNSLILSNFSFNNMDYIATYDNGSFSIDSSYYIAGCNFNFAALITMENGSLVINSHNKVVEGLCSNISDSYCVAISQ